MVSAAEIAHNDWNLSITRYIDNSGNEDQIDVPRAVRQLRKRERERAAAEATMNRYLSELGYDA